MAKITVTKTFLPPIDDYQRYIKQIWDSDWLTNQGPLLREFETTLEQRLDVKNLHFVSNGTMALQVALKALDITEGEIITTPFSYVATTSAILWERCRPVFVDIEPDTFCIDTTKIEAAITPRTKAIMPVHVFGKPCDTAAIDAIAAKHKLKVIYDAAHAFGVEYGGRSLLSYGDISICSFHATKLFHTIEGGCIIARDQAISDKVELTKRFGHHGDDHYMLGTNAKASEFQAAMGLCNLPYVTTNITERRRLSERYDRLLDGVITTPTIGQDTKYNYAYYPVVLRDEAQLQAVIEVLARQDIHPRRYFYPSLNTLPYLDDYQACPISESIASRIVCLPLYVGLTDADQTRICKMIKTVVG